MLFSVFQFLAKGLVNYLTDVGWQPEALAVSGSGFHMPSIVAR